MFSLALLHGLVAGLGLCNAVAPREPLTPERLAVLVRQLGSPSYAERERATHLLEAAGGPALDALRTARGNPSPEVRRRAETLVRRIERRLDTQRVLTPRTVRLAYRDTPLADAVADLAKRTGFTIRLNTDPNRRAGRKVTLTTGEVSCWEALALLCAKAALREDEPASPPSPLRQGGNSITIVGGVQAVEKDILGPPAAIRPPEIVLSDGAPRSLPIHRAGSVRVRALEPDAVLLAEQRPGHVLAGLAVDLESALRCEEILNVRIDRAVDTHGQALRGHFVPARTRATALPMRGTITVNGVVIGGHDDQPKDDPRRFPLYFRPGARLAAVLEELRGTVVVNVQTAPQDLVAVADVLNAAGKRFPGPDGCEVRVAAVTRHADGRVELRLEVAPPVRGPSDGSAPVMPNLNILVNGRRLGEPKETLSAANFVLLDRRGRPLEAVRAVSTGKFVGQVREYELTYRPAGGADEAARLVYRDRRAVLVEVPFVLRNVPLR